MHSHQDRLTSPKFRAQFSTYSGTNCGTHVPAAATRAESSWLHSKPAWCEILSRLPSERCAMLSISRGPPRTDAVNFAIQHEVNASRSAFVMRKGRSPTRLDIPDFRFSTVAGVHCVGSEGGEPWDTARTKALPADLPTFRPMEPPRLNATRVPSSIRTTTTLARITFTASPSDGAVTQRITTERISCLRSTPGRPHRRRLPNAGKAMRALSCVPATSVGPSPG